MGRLCVLVGYTADLLLDVLAEQLGRMELPFMRLQPHELGDLLVCRQDGAFRIGGDVVGGMVFRCRPDVGFTGSFVPRDQHFADTEIRALWLAALHLPNVYAVNRLDVAAWFGNNQWVRLRQRLMEQGVPVAPLRFGNQPATSPGWWLRDQGNDLVAAPPPHLHRLLGATLTKSPPAVRYLVVAGEVVGAEPMIDSAGSSTLDAASALLQGEGITLAEVAVDTAGRIVRIDTLPVIQPDVVTRTATLILEEYREHLHIR